MSQVILPVFLNMPNTSNLPSNNVKISSKLLQIQVEMLDSTRQHFQLSPRSSGQDLFSALLERVGAFEMDYFDLEYTNKEGHSCWLDHLKPLCKQHNADKEYLFTFCVKFYAPFPNLLDDEYTRYLFALQIKRDLLRGQLICSENTAALLAAFIVQGELGDFLEDTFVDRSYLDGRRLVPCTTPEFLEKVMECHRSLIGQTPTEADASLLDTARKVEMYGIRLKSVKGVDGTSMNLAVSHAGLFVFQGFSKINTFSWARIRKLSFKRKKFLIKLHPEGYDAVEFFFESRNECKSFWKHCIEHHAFFRCQPIKSGKSATHVTSASSVQVHKTPNRGGACNPSQQSLSSASCNAAAANYQQLQSTSQAAVTPARSLPLTGLDGASIAAATLCPSLVQLPPGTDCGSLRYPHRLMLVMPRRSEASLGHPVGASNADPAGAASPGSGFLVMLPSSATDHQQQNAWLSAIQQQRQQRPFSPVDSKESAYATLHTNAQSAPNGSGLQDVVGGYAQVLSPASLPSGASSRLIYVDASTGRVIPERQLFAMQHPSICMRKCVRGDEVVATSQAPKTANSSGGGETEASQGAQNLASPLPFPRHQVVGALATCTAAPLSSSSLPQLIRTRPPGPPPPAPQRRDSVHPRERQMSSSTLDSGITSKSASLSRPSFDTSGVDEESGNVASVPPPEVELGDPDPVHPFPFNVIPGSELDFVARRSLQASCLSLATRSLRSSCQSLLHTDCEDLRSHEDGNVEKNPLESRSMPRNHFTSRSASLHQPMIGLEQGSGEVTETSTQDDLATTWLANRGSATSCGDTASGSATSRSLLSLSTAASKNHACDDRFSRSSRRNSISGDIRSHPRAPASVAFHLLRELTMTERTYKKDLDVVCGGFREAVSEESRDSPAVHAVTSKLFALLDPVRTQAVDFLRELELRYGAWSSRVESTSRHRHTGATASTSSSSGATKAGAVSADRSSTLAGSVTDADSTAPFTPIRIGDLFVTNLRMLQLYRSYLRETECLITDLECLVRSRPSFQSKVQSFESLKSCYLPLYAFLLKPMHRLLQYRSVLERLMRHYSESNIDMQDSRVAHARLLDTIQSQWDSYKRCENLYKSLEVERDLVGLGSVPTTAQSSGGEERSSGWLAACSRQFIREGLLQKLSKRGYQQRMFFLFSDQLIYASRTNAPYLQFKVHGQFALHEVMVEEAGAMEAGTAAAEALSFTVYAGSRCFVVAASSEWQRDRWLEDISRAILAAKSSTATASASSALPPAPSSSVTEVEDDDDAKSEPSADLVTATAPSTSAAQDASKVLHRATTSVHVCWHRSSTFSMSDILRANEYQTSGYLLRKFKNSNGWQKLWVVFTQLCLFFHKSYQDTYPLASLPLLGYTITTPSPEDNIRKDFVFKLQFKNHVYFFRDDSQTSFERWFDCLSSAAGTSWRQRLVSSRNGGPDSIIPSGHKTVT